MKKHFINILILLTIVASTGYSQKITPDYKLLTVINRPSDLKWGIPSEILVDSINGFLIISYDYNPTYLDLYRINNWNLIKRIEIKGHSYLDNSYFSGNYIYIDTGRNKNKYIRIDLNTFVKDNIDCDKVPRGCPYKHIIDTKDEYYKDSNTTLINNDWYILKYDDKKTEIYIKTTTP